jgi:hypothetical protein
MAVGDGIYVHLSSRHECWAPSPLAHPFRRFMGIAEQMGRVLQRTSISVNIKERLDFSCALFDAQGGVPAAAAASGSGCRLSCPAVGVLCCV